MRRKDREVTDFHEIIDIVSRCEVIRLGLVDDEKPYIVPLNYAFEEIDGQVTFYFHSALEGRKIDIIKKNPYACFEMDCSLKITRNEVLSKWSTEYESVIGYGDIERIEDAAEKKRAMDLIVKRHGFEGVPEYSDRIFSVTALYKLTVSEISGKRNIE